MPVDDVARLIQGHHGRETNHIEVFADVWVFVRINFQEYIALIEYASHRRIRERGLVHCSTGAAPLGIKVEEDTFIRRCSLGERGLDHRRELRCLLSASERNPTPSNGRAESSIVLDGFEHRFWADVIGIVGHRELIARKIDMDVLDTWQL